jgi:hypothetical protein
MPGDTGEAPLFASSIQTEDSFSDSRKKADAEASRNVFPM